MVLPIVEKPPFFVSWNPRWLIVDFAFCVLVLWRKMRPPLWWDASWIFHDTYRGCSADIINTIEDLSPSEAEVSFTFRPRLQ